MMKQLIFLLAMIFILPVVTSATPIYPDPPDVFSGGGLLKFSGNLAFEYSTPIEVSFENVWIPNDVFDLMLTGYSIESTYIFSSYFGTGQYEWDPNFTERDMAATPIPGAIILLGTGLVGLAGFRKKINR